MSDYMTTTPSKRKASDGDRFIPSRSSTNIEIANYNLTSKENNPNFNQLLQSPSKENYKTCIASSLFSGHSDSLGSKVLSFKTKAPAPAETYHNNLRILYSQNSSQAGVTRAETVRHISQQPERILDAPDFVDDYYLNLLDWSANNILAVALGTSIYLWNASSGDIRELERGEDSENDIVTSVQFVANGNHLAVGTDSSQVQIWDVTKSKIVRTMKGHSARVSALSWNKHILSSGGKDSLIINHDVRQAKHIVNTYSGHKQEVCGLKWSPDGSQLASGSNDNLLMIWKHPSAGETDPQYILNQHTAAVKALDWCPFQSGLLASGGGSSDRCIKFWNTNNGTCINSIDTKSQVCSIKWSKNHRELVTSHGYSQNQLIVWKYPSMTKVTELHGHTERVLHLAMSPNGETIVSAAADERLRFWKIWPENNKKTNSFVSKEATKKRVGLCSNSSRSRAINIR